MSTAQAVLTAELQWFDEHADGWSWTYAKTMPATPHDYVVRGRTLAADDFDRAVLLIRQLGEPGKFYRRTNIYLVHRGYRYWTMGDTLDRTTIINRAPAEQTFGEQDAPSTRSAEKSVYDVLAPRYDSRYDRPDCHAENGVLQRYVFGLLDEPPSSVLDIGAGTGLALDLRLAVPSQYTAVDPSQAMLNELLRKHPTVRDVLPEPFTPSTQGTGFQLILALFGAASYLTPAAIDSIPLRLTEGGVAVLMAYLPGYWPDYYDAEPESAPAARQAILSLPNALHGRMGDRYLVSTVRRSA